MLNFIDVPEKIIKPIDEKNIFYNGFVYSLCGTVSERNNRNIQITLNNQKTDLVRQSPYLFLDKNNKEYLIYGNNAYLLANNNQEKDNFLPKLLNIESNIFSNHIKKNSLIEGDNLIALELMKEKYKDSIDFISIDPPYNTRNKDMRYNDYFPIINGHDKHSSWLSFMNNRLKIAKELLSNDGIIFINIDEFEYPYLKILCDQIFNEDNLVETFIWEKNSTKNNSKTTSNNHEYILCYAKNKKNIENLNYFKKKKEGIDSIYQIIKDVKSSDINDKQKEAQLRIRDFYKNNKNLKGIKQYKFVDENLNVYRISDVSAPSGGGSQHQIAHPKTGEICKNPAGGYRYTANTLNEHLKNNRIHFGNNEKTVPQYKRFLSDVENEVWKSIIKNTDEGKKDLEKIFGKSPFNNSKPVSLLKDLISMVNKDKMICLDFFAGSGSLGHAVIEYNQENNKEHSFILITNNESNIFYDVLVPRIKFFNQKNIFIEKIIFKESMLKY